MKVKLTEMFVTIQGEGPMTGVPSLFVRFGGCNLRCRWKNDDGTESLCDTPYASYAPEGKLIGLEPLAADIAQALITNRIRHVVLTGGEPTLVPISDLVDHVRDGLEGASQAGAMVPTNVHFTLETNGTNPVDLAYTVDQLCISPKLPSSGNPASTMDTATSVAELISLNKDNLTFVKVVAGTDEELTEAHRFFMDLIVQMELRDMSPPKDYADFAIMPQGSTPERIAENTPRVVSFCIKHDYRFCDRLHIRIWGGKRGV